MGRLIDADAFERSVMCSDAEDMQDVIYALRDYPTAYDPDQVVKQLETYSNADEAEQLGTIPVVELEDAIKIVKGGGVDA